MLFKDQAQALVAKWESLRDEDDIETLAAQTVIVLASEEELPCYVFDALDKLLNYSSSRRARSIHELVRYLRSLAEDDREKIISRS